MPGYKSGIIGYVKIVVLPKSGFHLYLNLLSNGNWAFEITVYFFIKSMFLKFKIFLTKNRHLDSKHGELMPTINYDPGFQERGQFLAEKW
jgi:hypothetical protein